LSCAFLQHHPTLSFTPPSLARSLGQANNDGLEKLAKRKTLAQEMMQKSLADSPLPSPQVVRQ
jgi:hypothetical protein